MYFMEDEDSVFRLQVSIRGDRFRFIFPGLTGRPGTVSIQSVDNPDYFVYSAEDLTLIMAAPADDLVSCNIMQCQTFVKDRIISYPNIQSLIH